MRFKKDPTLTYVPRIIANLSIFDGLSAKAIAGITGQPVTWVRKHRRYLDITRVRNKMSENIEFEFQVRLFMSVPFNRQFKPSR